MFTQISVFARSEVEIVLVLARLQILCRDNYSYYPLVSVIVYDRISVDSLDSWVGHTVTPLHFFGDLQYQYSDLHAVTCSHMVL